MKDMVIGGKEDVGDNQVPNDDEVAILRTHPFAYRYAFIASADA